MATAKPTAETGISRKYHLLLAEGRERDVMAAGYQVEANGALTLSNTVNDKVLTYADGQWVAVEVESRDDQG